MPELISIKKDQWELTSWNSNPLNRRPCRQKCGLCGNSWQETQTTHISYAITTENKAAFICSNCADTATIHQPNQQNERHQIRRS